MEDVIGFKDSPYAVQNGIDSLTLDVVSIILRAGEEPAMTGGYKLINSITDAVVLQYYETGTAFGKYISLEEVRKIGKVKIIYDEVLFTNHTTAVIVSNKLLRTNCVAPTANSPCGSGWICAGMIPTSPLF